MTIMSEQDQAGMTGMVLGTEINPHADAAAANVPRYVQLARSVEATRFSAGILEDRLRSVISAALAQPAPDSMHEEDGATPAHFNIDRALVCCEETDQRLRAIGGMLEELEREFLP